ncbi:hypothetical protein FA13DRAFT_1711651 [Coprinellus micaceus]|uniref:Uncharacterized protein n=1 Tax=Coprinellus micaceus TaxID=71717 RepID=A0A4Y7T386_COPMI|nr:hypothetical protein FA13DRAFT_1711651 [Coprinellus micaceus]
MSSSQLLLLAIAPIALFRSPRSITKRSPPHALVLGEGIPFAVLATANGQTLAVLRALENVRKPKLEIACVYDGHTDTLRLFFSDNTSPSSIVYNIKGLGDPRGRYFEVFRSPLGSKDEVGNRGMENWLELG